MDKRKEGISIYNSDGSISEEYKDYTETVIRSIHARDIIEFTEGKGVAISKVADKWKIMPISSDMDLGNGAGQSIFLTDEEAARFPIAKSVNRPVSIDLHQFEQNGKQCGVRVNFFEADDLMKVIEEGAKALNLTDRVWLTGYLKQ
jgi:hypothetical protein